MNQSHTNHRTGFRRPLPSRLGAQGGLVLIVGLFLLIVMSLLGVSMMTATRLQTMMAGGARESGIAFQAAEAALRDAEVMIEATSAPFSATTTAGTAPLGRVGEDRSEPNLLEAATWRATGTVKSVPYQPGDFPEMPADGQPRFILKHLGTRDLSVQGQNIAQEDEGGSVGPFDDVFRATARGTSRDGSAVTILQSYYGKIY